MTKEQRILIAVVLIVVIGAVAWFVFSRQQQTPIVSNNAAPVNNTQNENSASAAANQATNTNSTTPANNWKTYMGDIEGVKYQVGYPQNWRLAEQSNGGVAFGPRELTQDILWQVNGESVRARKSSTVINDIRSDANRDKNDVVIKDITVNGVPASLIVVSKPDTDFRLQYVVLESNGVVFTLMAGPAFTSESFTDFYLSFKVQ